MALKVKESALNNTTHYADKSVVWAEATQEELQALAAEPSLAEFFEEAEEESAASDSEAEEEVKAKKKK